MQPAFISLQEIFDTIELSHVSDPVAFIRKGSSNDGFSKVVIFTEKDAGHFQGSDVFHAVQVRMYYLHRKQLRVLKTVYWSAVVALRFSCFALVAFDLVSFPCEAKSFYQMKFCLTFFSFFLGNSHIEILSMFYLLSNLYLLLFIALNLWQV